ncbi:hypothetical protein [Iodobacter sp.]|uniref:hypothetical protein n=1 Tax=Iodobacter sp. TaxID=1915058 RepID=UPI0025FC716D|nr:hypothetical protein [Iodobacter sp.]
MFAEDFEAIAGMSEIGVYNFMNDPQLGMAVLPDTEDNKFYMIFTKRNPLGQELRLLVNKELMRLQKSGELRKMLSNYLRP